MNKPSFAAKKKKISKIIPLLIIASWLLMLGKEIYTAHNLAYLYDASKEEIQLCLEDKGVLSSWGHYSNDELFSRQFGSTGISELGPVTLAESQEITISGKTSLGAAKVAVLSPTGELDVFPLSSESYVAQNAGEYKVYSVMKHFWGTIQISPSD